MGATLEFGISDDEAGLVTQSVDVTLKSDKKEVRNKSGDVATVSYYNKTNDIKIDGFGTAGQDIGDSLSLAGTYLTLVGAAFVEEVSVQKANEDHVKSSVKATAYCGIAVGP